MLAENGPEKGRNDFGLHYPPFWISNNTVATNNIHYGRTRLNYACLFCLLIIRLRCALTCSTHVPEVQIVTCADSCS